MSEEQELFEQMLSKICESVLRDMGWPSAKQARAELRDRFAMAAMKGFLANDVGGFTYEKAREAWEIADAMLKARGDE